LDQELILADLAVVEKRQQRLAADRQRGRKVEAEELAVLDACRQALEDEIPLRRKPELALSPCLRGFGLFSAKPMLVLINNAEEDDALPPLDGSAAQERCLAVRGKLEHELAQMGTAEAAEFLKEYGIAVSAMDRVIQGSYELLGLMAFITVGEDEVKAWTIRRGTSALEAAGAIHSDIQKGFIRAEVVAYDDLVAAGTYAEARRRGTVRLEGKGYTMQDGDITHFRFNV
jgi:ribosome-binding ATPase YchF (GTP1/OBG family)